MKINILVASLVLLLSVNAYAWKERGNGGGAIVCRDQDENITYARVYDLWEGENVYNFPKIQESSFPTAQQLFHAIDKLAPLNMLFFEEVKKEAEYLYNEVISQFDMYPDRYLSVVADSFHVWMPSKCPDGIGKRPQYEQLVNYFDKGKFNLSTEIFSVINQTNRAAIILHEAIYKVLRDWQDVTSSKIARKITASLFSDMSGSKRLSILEESLEGAMDHDIEKYSQWWREEVSKSLDEIKINDISNTLTNLRKMLTISNEIDGKLFQPTFSGKWLLYRLNESLDNHCVGYSIHFRYYSHCKNEDKDSDAGKIVNLFWELFGYDFLSTTDGQHQAQDLLETLLHLGDDQAILTLLKYGRFENILKLFIEMSGSFWNKVEDPIAISNVMLENINFDESYYYIEFLDFGSMIIKIHNDEEALIITKKMFNHPRFNIQQINKRILFSSNTLLEEYIDIAARLHYPLLVEYLQTLVVKKH